ncbi:MAG: tRNA (adenosine(37)-N6)-threonylcarbamoyltransferase complex transferase subunit TsaD [Phycisphaerae bacterium]|jgi:N6-L-threonylcarbamoyladenine synthase|nr:tRNA (adenosine(37)-N6)-threonylcarbamoyltransferase complex transferase subunit TsaD [Phycisphaerae bacterium]HJN71185.1 tRNA (adenosine(37)-N6)-threonylcarbamoyltransferase complex transferase subunit TsaD [Phycisphaerales bacterium]
MTLILGIESSCDETAAAVVQDGTDVISNIVASQDELHQEYGGVVPEIASRAHLERILPVIQQAILKANINLHEIDCIAVGNRPGLIGSLLVGVAAAKALAWSLGKPLVAVDHVLSHLWAPILSGNTPEYPALGVVVSGGHTSLLLLENPSTARCIGKTIDDAAGEAFDKAASILEMGWPGGRLIDEAAQHGTATHRLPRPRLKNNDADFSFSGLKTALLYGVRGNPKRENGKTVFPRVASSLSKQEKNDWSASFQEAVVDTILRGVKEAITSHKINCIIAGGGVLANSRLRQHLLSLADQEQLQLHIPELSYCVDNAAMVAGLGWHLFSNSQFANLELTASPRGIAS